MDEPTTIEQLLQRFEAIANLSGSLLKAARVDDWDTAITLQQKYSALADTLRPVHDRFSLDASQLARRDALLRRILSDEAEVRDRAVPRLARLSALVASNQKTQALQKAYGLPRYG